MRSNTPAATSETVSLRASPTARPAAPSAANKPLVSTPSLSSAATSTTRSTPRRVNLANSGTSVGLTRELRSAPLRTTPLSQPARSQPATRMTSPLPSANAFCSTIDTGQIEVHGEPPGLTLAPSRAAWKRARAAAGERPQASTKGTTCCGAPSDMPAELDECVDAFRGATPFRIRAPEASCRAARAGQRDPSRAMIARGAFPCRLCFAFVPTSGSLALLSLANATPLGVPVVPQAARLLYLWRPQHGAAYRTRACSSLRANEHQLGAPARDFTFARGTPTGLVGFSRCRRVAPHAASRRDSSARAPSSPVPAPFDCQRHVRLCAKVGRAGVDHRRPGGVLPGIASSFHRHYLLDAGWRATAGGNGAVEAWRELSRRGAHPLPGTGADRRCRRGESGEGHFGEEACGGGAA